MQRMESGAVILQHPTPFSLPTIPPATQAREGVTSRMNDC